MGKPSSTDVVLCFKLGKNEVFSLNLTAMGFNLRTRDDIRSPQSPEGTTSY